MSTDSSATSRQPRSPVPPAWREILNLSHLEGEAGWWAPIGVSAQLGDFGGLLQASASSIYYLLDADSPINYWHWLQPEDTHILIDGGPLEYFIVPSDAPARRVVVGRDGTPGQLPVLPVPGNSFKALRLLNPSGFALLATVVSPGWTQDRVRIEPPRPPAISDPSWYTRSLIEELTSPDE